MDTNDDDSVSDVFRFWLDFAKEQELLRLLDLIGQEFRRRGQSLTYRLGQEPQAGH